MGLTIHYQVQTPSNWSRSTIRAKLELVRQFAATLPVVSVSELAEFKGKECDFQHIRESGQEEHDEFFWAKIQAQRSISNPWEPGCSLGQAPSHMIVFSAFPAEGCEPMNVGACCFPRHVWKARKHEMDAPAWSLAFDKRDHYPESRKVIQAIMKRWKLRRLPKSKCSLRERFGTTTKLLFCHNGLIQAGIHKGRYLSHRRGYAGAVGLVSIRDRMEFEIAFRHMGTAAEAEEALSSDAFKADMKQMVEGEDYVTPTASGQWSSFCKTQYANDPRCGGWDNFLKAHLSVLAILEQMQTLGFEVKVSDEGGFWEKRDLVKLAKAVGDYDSLIAGMAGALKDAASVEGMTVESAMSGRPDFEKLEMLGQGPLSEWLKGLVKK